MSGNGRKFLRRPRTSGPPRFFRRKRGRWRGGVRRNRLGRGIDIDIEGKVKVLPRTRSNKMKSTNNTKNKKGRCFRLGHAVRPLLDCGIESSFDGGEGGHRLLLNHEVAQNEWKFLASLGIPVGQLVEKRFYSEIIGFRCLADIFHEIGIAPKILIPCHSP